MSKVEKSLEMLHERRGDYDKISAETGLKRSWIAKFSRGQITDPGYQKIETLYTYLVKHRIRVFRIRIR